MPSVSDQFIRTASFPKHSPAWLQPMREASLQRFNDLGIPTQKNEDWRYTNLRALANKQFHLAQDTHKIDSSLTESSIDAFKMVFVGGIYQASLSDIEGLPEGVTLSSMSSYLNNNQPDALFSSMPSTPNAFSALNAALFQDGVFLHVGKDVQLVRPIELIFADTGEQTLSLPHNLIKLESGANATVIERQISNDASTCLSNSATNIFLDKDATLNFNLIQWQGANASHIGGTWAKLSQGSTLNSNTITLGGRLIRNELKVELDGEGADANCMGLFYGRKEQHIDNHTTIEHKAPNCTSNQLYKGILDDRARGVFHGRIKVNQTAQFTCAQQQNQNLLLSRNAEIDTKPQLEIYADEVKCAHGATVGELDNKQLFYLQSRGIGLPDAKTLLTFAFASDIIDKINSSTLRESLTTRIASQMQITDLPNS